MSSLEVLVVDDERLARARMRRLLSEYPDIGLIHEAASVQEAIAVVERVPVGLAFLDVQMPGQDGFQLVEHLSASTQVIFVTAYSDFAVQAFEVDALDYLVKPVSGARLRATMERAIQRTGNQGEIESRVAIEVNGALRFIAVDSIVYIAAADDYTELHVASGRWELVSMTMQDWEQRLRDHGFFRIHRRYLVNTHRVEALTREGTGWHVQVDALPLTLAVGRRRVVALREALARMAA